MRAEGSAPTDAFHSVQYLRGIAAVAVVYFHTKIYLADFSWSFGRQFGYGGVDLFFAISGFIMMVTTSTKAETPFSFYVKRIIRVVPLYWGATLASLILFLVVPSAFIKQTVTFEHVALSMLFIPHQTPLEGGTAPFFKIGWTLNFEMYFYLIFGVALLLSTPGRRLIAIAVFFLAMFAVGQIFNPQGAALGYYTSPFILEFLMGAVVGYATFKGHIARIPRPVIAVVAVASLGCWLFSGGYGDGFGRTLVFGLPTACLVACAVSSEMRGYIRQLPLMQRLGDASYSIYLAHPFVLTGFKVGAKGLGIPVHNPVVGGIGIILAVTAAALFGYLVYRFVEQPLLGLMRRALPARRMPNVSVEQAEPPIDGRVAKRA